MNRMSFPLSRPCTSETWTERIAIVAKDIVDIERSERVLRGPTALRADVVHQLRFALDPAVTDAEMHFVIDGQEMVMPSLAIRIVLQEEGFDWRSPTAAESVMVVAERAIDDALRPDRFACRSTIDTRLGRPTTWQERIVRAMGAFVGLGRRFYPDREADCFRKSILADFRDALGDALPPELDQAADRLADGCTGRDEEMESRSRTFWLILSTVDLDWYRPENAVEAMRVAGEALDRALAT